ncbi:MAG: glycoside hydrolase family 3 C-terminal domain-containing protein [Candidatus Limiplasma sp.]|nr:glycoside hydrolase family 3 C-terminal domain-containing protein [Candidatus Limiplasma sp.]
MDIRQITQRAQALVDQMTLEEAASQLRYDAPAIERLGIPSYNWWSEALHGVARAGTATVFPQAIGLAAMFDPQMLEEIAGAIATEARAKYNANRAEGDRDIYKGLTMWSPNVNIFRDPRWGRGHETYGEDPYLTSRLGVAFVKGLQGKGKYLKAAACAKHFAVHSGPEAERHRFDAVVGEKDLRETYLPAFEALVREAGVEAVMGAYNRVNGEPACGSPTLLKKILREEWGFQGHVVSDCWAISDFHRFHHVTDTPTESAALALENGCDLNCGNTYLVLLQALQEGLVTEEQIRLAATRLMATRIKLGMFDQDCEYDGLSILDNDTEEHHALAQRAAENTMVLLKNDGLLPLALEKLRTIAVIGPNADAVPALEGNYHGTSSRYTTFLDGIRQVVGSKARILFAPGSATKEDRSENLSQRPHDRLAEAVQVAKHADVVVLCVGLDETIEGEEGDQGNIYFSGDKVDLELPAPQRALVEAVVQAGTPVVTVLACGSALRVEEGNAILWAGYPGQAGGAALARILFGEVSPSGKLPVTFYHGLQELPPFEDYGMENRTYRYFRKEALYPFGYGLSYTRFAFSGAAVSREQVTVQVQNTGPVDAWQVVQAYIQPENCPDAPVNPSLCAFARVYLKAGEKKAVALPLEERAFTVVDRQGRRVRAGSRYRVFVGASQPDPRSAALTGEKPLELELVLEDA